MADKHKDLRLLHQYKSWLQAPQVDEGDIRHREFFEHALIVLDTNILLSLYELHTAARDEVINALTRVQSRLWLPHQVGLEFVRRRHGVIAARTRTLNEALKDIEKRFTAARQAIIAARDEVGQLYAKYAWNHEVAQELSDSITTQSVDSSIAAAKQELRQRVKDLKDKHDLALGSIDTDDHILPTVAGLYGDQVAAPVPPDVVRDRVIEAITYRFPNDIPPGFSDSTKSTDLSRAGDYLIWEEIIDRARQLPEPRRVIFVSSDEKKDWYEPAEPGRPARPWPTLSDELWARAEADLQILKSAQFFEGAHLYLDAQISTTTYEEIDRATETLQESKMHREAVHAVDDLRARLSAGESSDELLDSYLNVKRVLAESMQALVRDQLSDGCPPFHDLRDKLSTLITSPVEGKIPGKYLRIPYGSRIHEDLFAILYQNIGSPVSAGRLRIATGDSVHTERRTRELRELGLDIDAGKHNGEDVYTLHGLGIDRAMIRSIVANNIRRDPALSSRERDGLLRTLDEIDFEAEADG
ncbi:PIN-like domain-containing protein [Nonomuraea sp. NPDC050227]|uniref:PIN-like domain-containing protein n=1 Tax=Nonomuraea sp. NPDC050227 TaxID=3364360 RepID=UPI0037931C1B